MESLCEIQLNKTSIFAWSTKIIRFLYKFQQGDK